MERYSPSPGVLALLSLVTGRQRVSGLKPHDRKLWELFCVLYQELAAACGLKRPEIELDLKITERRYINEGFKFLGITMAHMLKHHHTGLRDGVFPKISDCRTGYRLMRNSRLPRLFHGFWRLIYDENGVLLANDSDFVHYDRCLRQLLTIFSKVKVDVDEETLAAQEEDFVITDSLMRLPDVPVRHEERGVVNLSQFVAKQVLQDFHLEYPLKPIHGPGAVFEKFRGPEKELGMWKAIPLRLLMSMREFGIDMAAFIGYGGFLTDELNEILVDLMLCPDHLLEGVMATYDIRDLAAIGYKSSKAFELIVRTAHWAIFVPKTVDKGRRIGEEYTICQAGQQGIKRQLQPHLEHWVPKGLTSASFWPAGMYFEDQTTNQLLAEQGSGTGETITIDSTSASDLVGLWNVENVLRPGSETLYKALMTFRSDYSRLHESNVRQLIPLKKFAGMGAATTFPVESLYFYCVAVASVAQRMYGDNAFAFVGNDPERHLRRFAKCASKVTVYGDDVIVHDLGGQRAREYGEAVVKNLELLGGRVNRDKTFLSGPFRESCGVDALKGKVVTPIKVRSLPPGSIEDSQQVVSYLASANLLYERGYTCTAELMWHHVQSAIGYRLPRVPKRIAEITDGLKLMVSNEEVSGCVAPQEGFTWRRVRSAPRKGKVKENHVHVAERPITHFELGFETITPHVPARSYRKLGNAFELQCMNQRAVLSEQSMTLTSSFLREPPEPSKFDQRNALVLTRKCRKTGVVKPRTRFVTIGTCDPSRGACSIVVEAMARG